MSEIETYVCTECDLKCKLQQHSEMEKQFPEMCPHGMIAHNVRTPWKRRVKRDA